MARNIQVLRNDDTPIGRYDFNLLPKEGELIKIRNYKLSAVESFIVERIRHLPVPTNPISAVEKAWAEEGPETKIYVKFVCAELWD